MLPVLAIWAGAALALAIPARRVVDWFVMNDELFYERLAFSVARTGSPLPMLHGVRVPAANQLYPVLLGSIAGNALVPSFLLRAHTFNAVLMTSAAIPAYLVARRTLQSLVSAYAAAALSVLVPWLVLASFVLSEAAAYPAFVWAVYLLIRAVDTPSALADFGAVAGLGVAVAARTQFAFLVLVALVAIPLREGRRSVSRHRLLAGVGTAAFAVALVLMLAGHNVFGAYNAATQGSIVDSGLPRSFLEHCAQLALGLGLLPPVLGAAWLGANARRSAGAVVSVLALAALLLEVASFDLRFGGGLPRDRYLFYAAPLLLIGFVGAVEDTVAPRWSLVAPSAIVVAGLALAPLPVFGKFNVDMPVATLDEYVRAHDGRTLLIGALLLLLANWLLARRIAARRIVAVVLVAATGTALAAETAYAFDRLFSFNGTSGRPITVAQGGVFDWVDKSVSPTADVTMIPYAQIESDYWATAAFWWDLEFWNRSVTRAAYPGNRFAEIQTTFPRLDLTFDRASGRASISPTQYVAESDRETRFQISGTTVTVQRDVRLIDAGAAWRADWITDGLDDDGFTAPGRTAVLRVFPPPGQRGSVRRFLTLRFLAATKGLGVRVGAGPVVPVAVGVNRDVPATVCVPARRPAVLRIRGVGSGVVHGDLGTPAGIGASRIRGVQVERISLADETAPC
jgi:Dolichyl-phosphate-mannose-protein mannosyltransferase